MAIVRLDTFSTLAYVNMSEFRLDLFRKVPGFSGGGRAQRTRIIAAISLSLASAQLGFLSSFRVFLDVETSTATVRSKNELQIRFCWQTSQKCRNFSSNITFSFTFGALVSAYLDFSNIPGLLVGLTSTT
jgi:hypothetical protein